jgi:hypothetical protein
MSKPLRQRPGILRLPELTKIRVGFSVALYCVLTLLGVLVCNSVSALHQRVELFCVAMGAVGLVLWLIGGIAASRRGLGAEVFGTADHPLVFLGSWEYWGLIVAGAAVLVFTFASRPEAVMAGPPIPPPPVVKPVKPIVPVNELAPPPATNTPVLFPKLRCEGLVLNGQHSTVVLNGRTVAIGEMIEGVTVVAIEPDSVTVELEGEQMVIGPE